jgi:hypothetical protein
LLIIIGYVFIRLNMSKETKVQILKSKFGNIYSFFKTVEQIPSGMIDQKSINHTLREVLREIHHDIDEVASIINEIPVDAIPEIDETTEKNASEV